MFNKTTPSTGFVKLLIIALYLFIFGCTSTEDHISKNYDLAKSADQGSIDKAVENFMHKYSIPGASIAITKDDKLVFSKGYGYANKKTGEEVTPLHLFRIASLSKPITAVAILKLAEKGKLSLDDKVFGASGILGDTYLLADLRIEAITVRQLLNHTSGGWQNNEQDPMFQYTSLDKAQLIAKILATRSLQHIPGTHYAYSNFGYCILGRIIEKVSGVQYESYIRDNILIPLGIKEMYIGGEFESERHPKEVTYYSQQKTSSYSMNPIRMDAHGGWIASSIDLVKLLTYMDDFGSRHDIISKVSVAEMIRPSSVNQGYALGWEVNEAGDWWHTGCLPGSGALWVRSHNGFCWTILVNSRSLDPDFFKEMDKVMWRIIEHVKASPDVDLFENKTENILSGT